ncbi:hypothetical protein PDESU_06052 [Pontiella desulfatans]|uniref:Uncharacterized protein n=1 Tax=Pontiella desulfatans TaxID=2750659 RepID=A0A6C2UE16_PONDE|nr:RNA-binding domain-containing protein [Pontiella desulfatans]VGO17456.1 hypothetical protein PDESU_06052 [Pontiella desulfatans]
MNLNQVLDDLSEGEGLHREFKEAREHLPRNLFETVCAFLNTDGGTIFLGVADDGAIKGVDPAAAERMKADLANLSNNPQKVDPPWLLFPQTFEIDEKTIIAVQVPLSSQLHKTGGNIILRSEDGDYRVQGTHQLAGLINRKLGLFTEQRTLPFATMDDLRPELFDRARRLMRSYNSKHPWIGLSDEEMLRIGGFYTQTEETGQHHLTLAAILMFGTDQAIQQAAPAYKFDCLLRRDNVDRYDDRVLIYTNLIDAYDQMMEFVEKHLNDPFHLEGDMRISLRDKIFREALSNIISHREYTGGAPARLMIYRDKVILDNPCTQHHFGEITPQNLRPFSKNPTICKFMIQLGRFDQLGSGVTNINKYLPLYTNGAKPIFKETAHGFELTLPLTAEKEAPPPKSAQVEAQEEAQVRHKLGTSQAQVEAQVALRILQACRMQPLSSRDIATVLGHKTLSGNLRAIIPHLRALELMEYTIPETPRSRQQKYRLTAKGLTLLENESPEITGEVTGEVAGKGTKSAPSRHQVEAQVTPQVTGKGTKSKPSGDYVGTKSGLSRDQVDILVKCREENAIGALMEISGRTDRTKFRNQVLNPLLTDGLVEMTIPDKPRSSKQKYRLTDKGRQLLENGS